MLVYGKTAGGSPDAETSGKVLFQVREKENGCAAHVVILGASGHARVIADTIRCSGDIVEGFLDDREADRFPGLQILGPICQAGEIARRDASLQFVIGIGKNEIRERIAGEFAGLPFYTAIHPSAVIAGDAVIGAGSVVMANAVVNTGAAIGSHCIVNTASSVDHDGQLADFVHLSPGVHLSGAVCIGRLTWLGIGAVVSNNLTICGGCVIGAGAAVIRNITTAGTYVGVPAIRINPI